ncbi:unnamed protein product [Larinioides sclopetarius]|uniref:Uncharacterized protein n=1 Tax=Larinioides sclopetarius TaxID=280406 RepID=A0AAV2A1M7_9ARAC
MDEERDENNEELKSHESEEVKDESSVFTPVIGQTDVTALHNNSDSDRQFPHKNEEYESLDPVDVRHLDSVYQYTSKIRQFIGLVDPNEDNSPVSSLENEKSDEASKPNLEKNDIDDKKLTDFNQDKNDSVLETFGFNDKTEKPSIDEDDGENEQRKSQTILKEEAESSKTDGSDSNVITTADVLSDNDEQQNLLSEISEKSLPDVITVTLPDAKPGDNPSQLKESDFPTIIPNDKMNSPLLESDENGTFRNGVDLNTQEDVLNAEENKLENEAVLDSNISTLKNEEHIAIISNEDESPKVLEEPNKLSNGDEQNSSTNEDSNLTKENVTNHSSSELNAISEEQDSSVTTEEIEQTPHFEDIRRLSVEIVNKVLDTAGTQLRDILNEKRKSNADANNLQELSPNSENAFFSYEGTVKASNFESVNVLEDKDKNNLTMNEGDSSQTSEQPEVKHKLNNEIQLKEVLAKTYDFNDFQKKIEVEMNKFDPKYDVDPDIVCGIGCFKPRWIQPWATSRVYLILYSIIGILSGSYYSYLIGAMSTLEKRFAFKSKTSGFVMMLDEITPLLLGIFIGYFGGKSHRPRMVGFGMILSSICCFISALPYFIYGPATHLSLGYSTIDNEKKLELCNTEAREGFCDDEDRLPTLTPVLLLMLGSFLKGFGNLAYYAVGLAYMDDNAKKKNTPMYFAIAFSLRLLGPMVGFLMSSFFLKYYENPFVDPGFEPSDPRWIGCWWMGFLVQGVLLLIFTIPISLFPRRLPGTVDYTKSNEDHHLATSFVGLFAALKRLAKNPVYCLIVVNAIMGIFGSFGHYIMLPRYMENQFRLSASTSNLISGPPSIGAVMVSMTTGGYLIWKFKPGARFLAAALCASELLQVCAYLILMIPRCERVEMISYGFNNDGFHTLPSCIWSIGGLCMFDMGGKLWRNG